ncbi:4112_t:CDS:2, partial [Dentiscutata erythropus]
AETDESEGTGNCLEADDIVSIDTRPDPKEIGDLTQEEAEIRNKLLAVLNDYQDKAKVSGATYMNSVCLNGILDLSNEEIYENVKKIFEINQLNWLEKVIEKKIWKPTLEFTQYVEQFTKNTCTRAEVPSLVRKSYILGRFDLCHHESHDIAQQILMHLSMLYGDELRDNLHLTSVEETPLKKQAKKSKNQPSSPGTPCPGSPCSELPFDLL